MATLTLSQVRPDFEDLVAQLQNALSTYGSWQDFLTSSTGQTLIEFLSTIGAFDQYSIERTLQAAFPSTAVNDSEIFAAVQMLGIRPNRKLPASLTVQISSLSPVTIPALSSFTGAGSFFFNRDVITSTNIPQEVTLFQGKAISISINGLGTDFQAFATPEKDFSVSDQDVYVILNAVSLDVTRNGLWEFKELPGVQDTTLQDGRAVVLFGTDLYGSKPGINDTVNITYVVTSGADGNNIDTLGKKLVYDNDTSVILTAVTTPSGGANQNSATVYKSVASPIFGSFGSAVTRDQYISTPFLYPGVVDCVTFAQREINPNALRWMNVIKVILLTSTLWNNAQYDAFFSWLEKQTMYAPRFYREDPVPSVVNVDMTIYCSNAANLSQAIIDAEAAVTALFTPRPGILNRNFYKTDITDAVFKANKSIEYIVLNTPTEDMLVARGVIAAPEYTLVGGGSLVVGQFYDYAISYVALDSSEYAPANWRTLRITPGNSAVQLTWAAAQNVLNYKVWGRQSTGILGLIATTAPGITTYIDTGGIVPVAPLLEEDTVSTRYNSLGTLAVDAQFSTRRKV